jgi:hypothetical protein
MIWLNMTPLAVVMVHAVCVLLVLFCFDLSERNVPHGTLQYMSSVWYSCYFVLICWNVMSLMKLKRLRIFCSSPEEIRKLGIFWTTNR